MTAKTTPITLSNAIRRRPIERPLGCQPLGAGRRGRVTRDCPARGKTAGRVEPGGRVVVARGRPRAPAARPGSRFGAKAWLHVLPAAEEHGGRRAREPGRCIDGVGVRRRRQRYRGMVGRNQPEFLRPRLNTGGRSRNVVAEPGALVALLGGPDPALHLVEGELSRGQHRLKGDDRQQRGDGESTPQDEPPPRPNVRHTSR